MENKGWFKKGHNAWAKGKSFRNSPSTEFKKGKLHPNYGKRGKECPNFKGKRILNSQGYYLIYSPNHIEAFPSGYVLEHRYKMSNKLKRKLKKGEIVHHIDGNRSNNRLNNLFLITKDKHLFLHNNAYHFIVFKKLTKEYLEWIKTYDSKNYHSR